MMQMLRDFTAPYSAAEAWLYDAIVSPASTALVEAFASAHIAALPAGARVLDVGCGGGQNAIAIAERQQSLEVTGLDLNDGQVARARRRADKRGVDVTFINGSALDLPFDDGEFDLVLSIASIKHWPDQAKGLSECTRVLKPGGQLFVAEADRGCLLDDARDFVGRTRVPKPLRGVALAGFRTWVAGQGLDLDDARALLSALPLASWTAERVANTPAVLLSGTR